MKTKTNKKLLTQKRSITKALRIFTLLMLLMLTTNKVAWGVMRTSNGSGLMSTTTTWNPAGSIGPSDVLTILSGHTVTVNANVTTNNITVSAGGTLIISSGTLSVGNTTINGTLNLSGSGTLSSSAGGSSIFFNTGGICNNNGGTLSYPNTFDSIFFTSGSIYNNAGGTLNCLAVNLNFQSSTYNHNINGGAIPLATWNAASNCNINGITNTAVTGLGQVFGNFNYNCASQGSLIQLLDGDITTNGNFILASSGVGSFSVSTFDMIIKGNFAITGGNFVQGAGTQKVTFNGNAPQTITGNITFNNLVIANMGLAPNNTIKIVGATTSIVLNGTFDINIGVFDVGTSDFTVTGTTNIASVGGFTDTVNTGTNSFNGTLTVATGGSFTQSTLPINNSNYVFRDNITNSGVFDLNGTGTINFSSISGSAGTLIITANTATAFPISATASSNVVFAPGTTAGALYFKDITINAPQTVVNDNISSLGVTFFNGTLLGTGNFTNNTKVTFNSVGAPMASGTLTANIMPNTVVYDSNGTTIKNTIYHHLLIGAGTKTLLNLTTVNGNFGVITGTSVNLVLTIFDLIIKGDWTGGNTIANVMNVTSTSTTGTVRFNTNLAPQQIQGFTNFSNLEINNTFISNPTVTLNTPVVVTNALALTAGRIVLGNNNLTYQGIDANLTGGGWIETNNIGAFIRTTPGVVGSSSFPVGDAFGKRNVNFIFQATATFTNPTSVRFVSGVPTPSVVSTNIAGGVWVINASNGGTVQLEFQNVGGTSNATSVIHTSSGSIWNSVPTTSPTYTTIGTVILPVVDLLFTVFTPTDFYSIGVATWNINGNWSYTSGGTDCSCNPSGIANANVRINHNVSIPNVTLGTNNIIDIQNASAISFGYSSPPSLLQLSGVSGSKIVMNGGFLPTIATSSNFFAMTSGTIVEFVGAGGYPIPVTFSSTSYKNLVISGGGVKSITTGITVNESFTVSTNATFDPAGSGFIVGGTTNINGTFSDNTSGGTNVFNGAVSVNAGGVFQQSISNASNYVFQNNITNVGTFNLQGTGNIQFTGNLTIFNNSITGTVFAMPTTANTNIIVDGTASTSVNFNGLAVMSSVTVTNNKVMGIFRGGNLTGTGTFINNGQFNINGTALAPTVTNFNVNTFSNTVVYDFDGGNIRAADYQNLIIYSSVSSGTRTLAGNVTVNGNFNVNASVSSVPVTLNIGSSNLIIKNNWNVSSPQVSLFTITGVGVVIFSGANQQTISGLTTFNNLDINNSSGVTANNAITVNNMLTLTNGILTLGNNQLTINNPILGTAFSNSKCIILGSTGQISRLGVLPGSNIFFPCGTINSYNPVTISNTSAGGSIGVQLRPETLTEASPFLVSERVKYLWTVSVGTAMTANIKLEWNPTSDANITASNTNVKVQRLVTSPAPATWVAETVSPVFTAGATTITASNVALNNTTNATFGVFGTPIPLAVPTTDIKFVGKPNKIVFSWEPVPNATSYEVRKTITFKADGTFDWGASRNVGFVLVLNDDIIYDVVTYYSVRSLVGVVTSNWSPTVSIFISSINNPTTALNADLNTKISISPNPATDSFIIDNVVANTTFKENNIIFSLMDMTGKIISTETTTQGLPYKMNLDKVAKGLYYVKITTKENAVIKKVVKE